MPKWNTSQLIASLILLVMIVNGVFTLSDEKRLIKRLLKNYEDAGITGRPVKSTKERVFVNMSLSLIQILDLDEKNQVLTISVWLLFNWKDHILKWDPNNYSQVVEVRVPPKQIWTPDIVLYNYADERLKEMRDAMVIVQYDGSIKWMPPAIFKSNCKIDIKRFPFDEQTCHMKFGSWTYDGNRLDVLFIDNEQHVLLDDYTESNEWEIIARPAMRNVKYYPCCQEPYPDLTYFLFLRRNAAFFSYILVLPCVLLSSLTLVIFWLPPESPAKMVLGMNIFVAFFLLLLLLADSTPQASTSVPYIGYYYCLNMILITLSSFLSVIVINLYFRGDRTNRVPWWIRKLCQLLSGNCKEDNVLSDSIDTMTTNQTTKNSQTGTNPRTAMIKSNPDTAVTNGDGGTCGSMIPYKPIISVNGRQSKTSPLALDTVAMKKTRKGRTRFANTGVVSSGGVGGMGNRTAVADSVETLLYDRREPPVLDNLALNDCDTVMPTTVDDLSKPTSPSTEGWHQPTSNSTTKHRSRSLTPNKDINNITPSYLVSMKADHCQHPISAIQQSYTCRLCASEVAPVPAQNPWPASCLYCTAVDPLTGVPLGNSSTNESKHQRHPENCPMCLQQASALRSQQQSLRRGQHEPIGAPMWAMSGSEQASFNVSNTCCPVSREQVRYEYRDGRLVLVPQSMYGRCSTGNNPPASQTLTITSMGSNAPDHRHKRVRSVGAHEMSDRKANRLSIVEPREQQQQQQEVDRNVAIEQFTRNMETELQDIRHVIRSYLSRISKKDAENVIVREWRMVAKVLDRIFFLCYLIIHLCAAFGLLVPSTHEADVIGFMRDYRLKNYNSTFTKAEAATLSPLALAQVSPEDRVFGRSLDRPSPTQPDNRGEVIDASKTVLEATPASDQGSKEPHLPSQTNSDMIGSFSPYQRLADRLGINQRDDDNHRQSSSLNRFPQSDEVKKPQPPK